jgi:hypothetical protein
MELAVSLALCLDSDALFRRQAGDTFCNEAGLLPIVAFPGMIAICRHFIRISSPLKRDIGNVPLAANPFVKLFIKEMRASP